MITIDGRAYTIAYEIPTHTTYPAMRTDLEQRGVTAILALTGRTGRHQYLAYRYTDGTTALVPER